MKNFSQDEAKVIYNDAKKKGLDPDKVMAELVNKGATFEGIDMNQARQYAQTKVPKAETNFGERAKETIMEGRQAVQDINSSDASLGTKIAQNAAQVTGLPLKIAFDALPKPAREGLTFVGDAIASGFKAGTDKIADTKLFTEIGNLEAQGFINPETAPEFYKLKDALAGVGAAGETAANLTGLEQGITGVGKLASKAASTAVAGADALATSATNAASAITPESASIMNRVARLTPKQANTFEKLAGKSHGEYLAETGNFGTPDKIISNEAVKFTKSLTSVDDALAKLPGKFTDGSIEDALTQLVKKGQAESGANIKSPYLNEVVSLQQKATTEGLSMSEINQVKRLFEKNVKLGYNKLMNGTEVAQATNIDNAIRKWQVAKAKELGFSNISELNKQTQLSKFIIDNLGSQVVGKTGLNGVNLTDWIMLSGGDPTAVGGFLTKKFFSSKSVQAKIAEMLKKGEIKGQIEPIITPSTQIPQPQVGKQLEIASPKSTTQSLKGKGTIPENSPLKSLYETAPAAKAHIDTLAESIANKHGGVVAKADLKSHDSAIRKLVDEKGGDTSAITDISRNTIVVPKNNISKATSELFSHEQAIKPKTTTHTKDTLGYSGGKVNIKTPNGHIAEVQINTPEMIFAKEPISVSKKILGDKVFNQLKANFDAKGIKGGKGHVFYEQFRNLPRLEQALGRNHPIAKESIDYYAKFR